MNDDSDKTMMLGESPPGRGNAGDGTQGVHVLPKGTRLGEFEVVDLIGEGGFGAVYLAYDHSLDRHVALKEYMPTGLATRNVNLCVTVRSHANAGTFTAGLRSFINEAKMLAQFDSPSLVKVHRFWEANGTAYMVMPYYDGMTLKQALKERKINPDERWIRQLLVDLLDAIETIHKANCFHRDIAPDNILLLKDGRPLLLDFGAARRVIGDLTQCLTVILKPGFAPIEQYADIAGLRQGPWTDIYALAAVVYYLITGNAPPPAVARVVHDELVPAGQAGKGRYSAAFLAMIDNALAVKPEQRYQSIAELRRALDASRPVVPAPRQAASAPRLEPGFDATAADRARKGPPTATAPLPARGGSEATWRMPPPARAASVPGRMKSALIGLVLCAGIGSGLYLGNYLADRARMAEPAGTPDGSIALSSGDSDAPAQQAERAPAPASAAPAVQAQRQQQQEREPQDAQRSLLPHQQAQQPAQAAPPPPQAQGGQENPQTQAPPVPAPRRASRDEESWNAATAGGSAEALERHLRAFPHGRHSAEARRRLDALREQKEAAAGPVPAVPQETRTRTADARSVAPPVTAKKPTPPEDALWDLAVSINQPAAYESYLGRYPHGRFAALARDRLAVLRPEMQQQPPAAAKQADALPPSTAPAAAPPIVPPAQAAARDTPPIALARPSSGGGPHGEARAEPGPSPEAKPPAESGPPPASRSAAEAAPGADDTGAQRTTLQLPGQTMIGSFRPDPATGIVSGSGRIIWKDGNRFEGTLVRGMKEGRGQFTWTNGQRYNGDWVNDVPNGKGTITYPNGNRYQGDVKNGLPDGTGTITYAGGDTYRGGWQRGKSHGQGRYTWKNGSYWEGEFRDDARTANGTMVFSEAALRAARELQSAGTAPR
ncbi:MAG TPA: protein kinase [Noviherbaspirillum sp.]|jgi:serine/threonine protein kinase|uniref:protein kinase domain-containing protein n=1 Tax=Noviherbaspirillum sp. TaxID=1926288 RepID=UPI002F952068